jgi:hypothetical protein
MTAAFIRMFYIVRFIFYVLLDDYVCLIAYLMLCTNPGEEYWLWTIKRVITFTTRLRFSSKAMVNSFFFLQEILISTNKSSWKTTSLNYKYRKQTDIFCFLCHNYLKIL